MKLQFATFSFCEQHFQTDTGTNSTKQIKQPEDKIR